MCHTPEQPGSERFVSVKRDNRHQSKYGTISDIKEHAMATESLKGCKVAFLAADGVQQDELNQPWEAVKAAGSDPYLISIRSGDITSTVNGKEGRTFRVDALTSEANANYYDALVIPGGLKSPDTLRIDADAVMFVRGFMEHDKPVAAICHGPWLLIEADAVRGRTLTSYPSLQTDIRNAGGFWVNRQVNVDQKLITSRTPADLQVFCSALILALSSATQDRALDSMVEQTFPASDPLPGPSAI
jgi:protease I